MAFARYQQRRWYLIAIPVQFTALMADSDSFGEISWGTTRVRLPELAPEKWKNLLTGGSVDTGNAIHAADLFGDLSVAFYRSEVEETGRDAGVLLHLTSLPGKYGTGDMGKEAFDFVEFLQETGQTRWQILPLNYVDRISDYSPYSCLSAFAGNILLINPGRLHDAGLVSGDEIGEAFGDEGDEACFDKAETFRLDLLSKAWQRFVRSDMPLMKAKFETFCEEEKYWLDDFAFFLLFRELHGEKKWNEWPVELRDRHPDALASYRNQYRERLDEIRFSQFLFFEQWNDLKTFANERGIRIIGDMPFYVNFDSADVWSHPDLFKLGPAKANGNGRRGAARLFQ